MSEEKISLLRDEAQRLLKEQIKLLKEIQATPELLVKNESGGLQTFDVENVPEVIKQLEGEKNKLSSLELVLAVVGTVKAGKSTTINAIVGMEVLPNRNRPMTALPTLIRHTQGTKKPRLIFKNTAPVNELMSTLGKKLKRLDAEQLNALKYANEFNDLIGDIYSKKKFAKSYEGANKIFDFLSSLNDLVRLSHELDVQFPFAKYESIENLPAIEVEFSYLNKKEKQLGRLALLDTPGPNEAGQAHLRLMLRDQLKKASAVLAVLDYSQLKSDADYEMRENLIEISKVTGDRLYALVNRFDLKDRNSDDAETTRGYVSNNLMKGIIPIERIFPVSARNGYLASQAKVELELKGSLPDYNKNKWVVDFAEKSMHPRNWKQEIHDVEKIAEAASFLWKESMFNSPLEQIVGGAYDNAAIFAVESAATKMVSVVNNLSNFLGVRRQAFNKTVDELAEQVKSLQKKLSYLEGQHVELRKDVQQALEKVGFGVLEANEFARDETVRVLDGYFKDGRPIKSQSREMELSNSKSKRKRSRAKKNDPDRDFISANGPIRFESKYEADELLSNIASSLRVVMSDAENKLKDSVECQIGEFVTQFEAYVERAKETIHNIKKDMVDFDLVFEVPVVEKLEIGLVVSDVLKDITRTEKEKQTRYRRKDSLWGRVCGWLGTSDWGYESYSIDVSFYDVDINEIKEKVLKTLSRDFDSLETLLLSTFKEEILGQVGGFFSVLNEKVENIQGDLITSMNDHQKSKAAQELLVSNLLALGSQLPNLIKDGEQLLQDIEGIRKGQASYG